MAHAQVQEDAQGPTGTAAPAAFPLALAAPGEQVEVVALRGGEGLQRRLAAMGLHPGSRCEVVQNERPGGLVVRIGEARFGLGMGMVQKILVVRRP